MSDERLQPGYPLPAHRAKLRTGISGRVCAKRDFELWQVATVEYENDTGILVVFDNMDEALLAPSDVKHIDLQVGDVVFVQRHERYFGGQPAKIAKVLREAIEVQYLNPLYLAASDKTIEFLRDIRWYAQPVEIPWQKGDRVCAYGPTFGDPPVTLFFPGVVEEFHYETCVEVDFDDGKQTVLPATLIQALAIHPGDCVYVRNDNIIGCFVDSSPYVRCRVLEYGDNEVVVREQESGRIVPVHISLIGMVPRGYQMLEGKLVRS
jgi:hypothetical protein